jgi:hypothetical protein
MQCSSQLVPAKNGISAKSNLNIMVTTDTVCRVLLLAFTSTAIATDVFSKQL